MNKLIVRTNTVSNDHFDEFGKFFGGGPRISVNSTFRLEWYLYTDTPDENNDNVNIENWIPDTTLSGYSAIVTCDSDWVHRVSGTLETENIAAGNTFPEQISVKIASAGSKNIAPSGKFTIYNDQGKFQTVLYTEREIQENGSSILLTIGEGVTADYGYSSGDSVTVSQEVYFEAVNVAEESEPENGKFVFDVIARSRKLQSVVDTATNGNIPIQGLEFLPFKSDDSGNYIQAPAYLLDSAVLISTIGDPVFDAQVPDSVKSEIAGIVGGLIKGKLAYTVSDLADGKIIISGKMNPPVGLLTDKGNYYPVEKGSLTVVSDGFELDPTVYMAYDGTAEFAGTWTVYLGSEVSGGGGSSAPGVTPEEFNRFKTETEATFTAINETLEYLEDETFGMLIKSVTSAEIPFVHDTVIKHTLTADETITFTTSSMPSDRCVTMELWLTMPETVVSFSIPNVNWLEEPSFDTANTLYAVVLRWDGEKVLANVAYTLEVS